MLTTRCMLSKRSTMNPSCNLPPHLGQGSVRAMAVLRSCADDAIIRLLDVRSAAIRDLEDDQTDSQGAAAYPGSSSQLSSMGRHQGVDTCEKRRRNAGRDI